MESTFLNSKIEYYATLSIDDVRLVYPELLERESFTPRSVIVYLVPYFVGKCENISTYAASLDYHLYMRELNERLAARLTELYPTASVKGYVDHSPIDEIDAAARAGLGVRGMNRLLINEKYGSFVFIGELITDIEPEKLDRVEPIEPKECISCGKCLAACPTGTLLSGADCLSHITQKKGELTDREMALIIEKGTAWGCDICQTVCPHNANPAITPIDFFHRDRVTTLTRAYVDSLDRDTLRHRAFGWRGRRVLERNLEILGDGKKGE